MNDIFFDKATGMRFTPANAHQFGATIPVYIASHSVDYAVDADQLGA